MIIKLLKRIWAFFAHLSHLHNYGVNPERNPGIIVREDGGIIDNVTGKLVGYAVPLTDEEKDKIKELERELWWGKNYPVPMEEMIDEKTMFHLQHAAPMEGNRPPDYKNPEWGDWVEKEKDKISDPNNGLLPLGTMIDDLHADQEHQIN